MTYEDLISEFKTVRYCCHRLIEINEELEVLNHQKTGLARSGPDLTPEQIRSPLPMPHYQPQYHSPLALYETPMKSCSLASAVILLKSLNTSASGCLICGGRSYCRWQIKISCGICTSTESIQTMWLTSTAIASEACISIFGKRYKSLFKPKK